MVVATTAKLEVVARLSKLLVVDKQSKQLEDSTSPRRAQELSMR